MRMSRTFLDRNFGRLALAKNVPFCWEMRVLTTNTLTHLSRIPSQFKIGDVGLKQIKRWEDDGMKMGKGRMKMKDGGKVGNGNANGKSWGNDNRWWEGGSKMGGKGGGRGERWEKMWREGGLKMGGR